MKKLVSIIMAITVVVTMSITAFAEQTTVTYNITDSYTVIIPQTITVGQVDNSVPITATTNLEIGRTLCVKISNGIENDNGDITLANGNGSFATTHFYYNDGATTVSTINDTIAEFMNQNTDSTDSSRLLMVQGINPAGKAAGTYSKTIEFTISINEAG